jgi:hypothetical protein
MALASLIIAVTAILIALASAEYTRRQAAAAELVAKIETARRHEDLTPELYVRRGQRSDDMVILALELRGPVELGRLDEVRVRIRDDHPGRASAPVLSLSTKQRKAAIWGPCRFNPGVLGTDPLGREHGPFGLSRREPYLLSLEQSVTPTWHGDPALWRRQVNNGPVRLEVTCRREGYAPWVLLGEIDPQEGNEPERLS